MENTYGAMRDIGSLTEETGEFCYGCLIPGHFEAGMVGKVKVLP